MEQESDQEDRHHPEEPTELHIKKDMTKDLLTIFSDSVTVQFKKNDVVKTVRGWCLQCKLVSQQHIRVLDAYQIIEGTKRLSGSRAWGKPSLREATPPVTNIFVSTTTFTNKSAERKTYRWTTGPSHHWCWKKCTNQPDWRISNPCWKVLLLVCIRWHLLKMGCWMP